MNQSSGRHRNSNTPPRRTRLLLAILACSILALATIIVGGDNGEAPLEPAFDAVAVPSAMPEAASFDRSAGAGTAADAADRVAAATAAVAAATPKPARPAVPHEHQLILVVDPAGNPVADAEVAAEDYLAPPITGAQKRAKDRLVGFDELAMLGQRTRTDEGGFAIIRGGECMWLAARKNDLYAWSTLMPDAVGSDVLVVRMEPEQRVAVRVVDALGKGIPDVPVTISAEYPPVPGWRAVSSMSVGYTDAEGNLTARHLQQLRRHIQPLQVTARVDCPGLAAAETRVADGATAVTIVVTTFGSVRIRLLGRDGTSVPDDPPCHVWVSGGGTYQSATADHGEWVFSCVGLGVPIEVGAHIQGHSVEQSMVALQSHGQQATAILRLPGEELASVRGRLVNAKGEPQAAKPVSLCFLGDSHYSETDAQGRFLAHLLLPDGVQACECRALLRSTTGEVLQSGPFSVQRGTELDCKDLTLTAGTALCCGEIVGRRPPDFHIGVNQYVDGRWTWTEGFSTAIAEDGAFTVFTTDADAPGRQLRIVVSAPGCLPIAPIEFRHGQQGLRIELLPGLAIAARILVDPWVLHVYDDYDFATLEQGDEHTAYLACSALVDSIQCASRSLAPGSYSLRLNGHLELLRIDDIDIRPGSKPDPRLDPIDLRGRLQLLTVNAVDAERQQVIADAECHFRVPGTQEWRQCWTRLGSSSLLSLRQTYEVCLLTDDFAPVTCLATTDRVDVVMPRMTRRSVMLEGLPDLASNAPIELRILPEPDWAARRGLPPDANPIRSVNFESSTWTVTCSVAEDCDALLEIGRTGDESETIARIPVRLTQAAEPIRVVAPTAAVTKVLPFAKAAK